MAGRSADFLRDLGIDCPLLRRRADAPQSERLGARALDVPLTLALATGMSVNNALGVLEAIFNHRSDFSRTPKYGIEAQRTPMHRVRTFR